MLSTLNKFQFTIAAKTPLRFNTINSTHFNPNQKQQKEEVGEEAKKKKERCQRNKKIISKFLTFCSYGGIGTSSLFSASMARKGGMSPVGSIVLGGIGGMGGGSMRDIIQGKPVYWLNHRKFAWLSFSCALVGTFAWDSFCKPVLKLSETDRWATVLSLCSLGGCTCSGAETAWLQAQNDVVNCAKSGGRGGSYPGGWIFTSQPIKGMVYALLCATGGGVVRDCLLGRKAGTLHPNGFHLGMPPLVGALAYLAARNAKLPYPAVVATGFITSVSLRTFTSRRYQQKQQQQQQQQHKKNIKK